MLPAALAEIFARAGAGKGAVFWFLWIIGASPLAVVYLTVGYARRQSATSGTTVFLAVTAGVWAICIAVGALFIWWDSAKVACHGGYECPF